MSSFEKEERSVGPLYMTRRYQSDQGMLTMYFADQRLLTFKYLNHGPILHLKGSAAATNWLMTFCGSQLH